MGNGDQSRLEWKTKVIEEAKLRGYSQKTIKSYFFHIEKYIFSKMSPRVYLLSLIEKKKANETVRLAGFAVKFYLKTVSHPNESIKDILKNLPNQKREKKLPVVLAKEEIERMIMVTPNLVHRTIIQIGYATGMRVSEIINLQWSDLDYKRKVIHIKKAKGKKDRIVMLSPKIKKALNQFTLEKKGFVFKTNRGTTYSPRTLQMIIQNAAKKAGIQKNVTPHSLRHSFATHLLEKGTDIRYIKDLLGHSNISTTLIYTKVSNKNICKIKSPLDD